MSVFKAFKATLKGFFITLLVVLPIFTSTSYSAKAGILKIQSVFLKQNAYAGKCRIMIRVKNTGGSISSSYFNQMSVELLQGATSGNGYTIWGGYGLDVVDPNGMLKKPGATFTFPWNAILLKPGSYRIGAKIVAQGGTISTFNPIRLVCNGNAVRKLPDLTVARIGLDKRCRVMVTVKNVGKGMLPSSVWLKHTPKSPGIYLYINNKGWGGASFWKIDPSRKLRKPGGSITYKSSLQIKGKVRIKAVIDTWNKIEESNKRNNTLSKTLVCKRKTAYLPDLSIESIKLTRGCKILVTIVNKGKGALPASAYSPSRGVAIQMYNNNKPWGGMRLSYIDRTKTLLKSGGKISFVWFPYAKNLSLKKGANRIKLVIDNGNVVRESNENNNKKIVTLQCNPVYTGTHYQVKKPFETIKHIKNPPREKPNTVLPNDKIKNGVVQ